MTSRIFSMFAGFAILAFAGQASGQGLTEMVFNAGVNFGAAERLTEMCPRYRFDKRQRRRFEEVARLQRSAFGLGRQKGRSEIAKLLAEQQGEMLEAMACLSAVMMFGPHGSVVSDVLIEDEKVAAREEAKRKKREAARKAKAEARKSEPAPAGAKEGDLIIDQDEERPDKLAGRHAMRLKTVEYAGMSVRVGCVPCFNAMTIIGIHDGVPYALNGLTRPRLGRYRVVINGKAQPVRDVDGSPLEPLFDLISEAQKVPGCDAGSHDLTSRLARAVTEGKCLAW